MTKFAIATAVYPQDQRLTANYLAGIGANARGHGPVTLVAVADCDFDAEAALRPLPDGILLELHRATVARTPAGLRHVMVEAASHAQADMIVFTDFDDRAHPDALARHAGALENADVSYGDLDLMDDAGVAIGRRFFDGAKVPEQANASDLRRRNFIGFGNSAARRDALNGVAMSLPDDVVAADWWFFSVLLAGGRNARSAGGPVSMYRLHANSVLGGISAGTRSELQRRAEIALQHYLRLPEQLRAGPEAERVASLLEWIESEPERADALAARLPRTPGVWFEDVARACDWVTEDRMVSSR